MSPISSDLITITAAGRIEVRSLEAESLTQTPSFQERNILSRTPKSCEGLYLIVSRSLWVGLWVIR